MLATALPVPAMDNNRFDADAAAQMERMVQTWAACTASATGAAGSDGAHHEALFRLALAAEFRDNDTGAHIVRMGFLAEALALAAGAPREVGRAAAQGRAHARRGQDRHPRCGAEEARQLHARRARW
jgi:response regulator RpfG family c-di-GMP phosphodiesterase